VAGKLITFADEQQNFPTLTPASATEMEASDKQNKSAANFSLSIQRQNGKGK